MGATGDGSQKRLAFLASLRTALHEQLAALESLVGASRDEATGAESRPENKYDTRALEASYLASGQGRRLLDLRQLVEWVDGVGPESHPKAALGAFVLLEEDDGERWVFLAPSGGPTVPSGSDVLHVVGVQSPLGRALLGTAADDVVEFEAPSGPRELVVVVLL